MLSGYFGGGHVTPTSKSPLGNATSEEYYYHTKDIKVYISGKINNILPVNKCVFFILLFHIQEMEFSNSFRHYLYILSVVQSKQVTHLLILYAHKASKLKVPNLMGIKHEKMSLSMTWQLIPQVSKEGNNCVKGSIVAYCCGDLTRCLL